MVAHWRPHCNADAHRDQSLESGAGELQRSIDIEALGARASARIAWSPDGRRIAALVGRVATLYVFSVEDGAVEFETQAHAGVAIHIEWPPDGALLATGRNDGLVKLWDTSDWTVSQALLNEGNLQIGGRYPINAIAFSPDSRRLASSGYDRTVKLCSVEDGTQLAVHDGFLNSTAAVAWSADGSRYSAASWDGTAIVLDGASMPLAEFEGHLVGRVLPLSFAPSLSRLVTSGTQGAGQRSASGS